MRALSVLFVCLGLLGGCRSKPAVPSPTKNGSHLHYELTHEAGGSSIQSTVRLSFASVGELFEVRFASAEGETEAPLKVDAALTPKDRIIKAHRFGQLWLPPSLRRVGAAGTCGRITRKTRYVKWDVWEMFGRCGSDAGSRFFDVDTGYLVGYQLNGNRHAKLLTSDLLK